MKATMTYRKRPGKERVGRRRKGWETTKNEKSARCWYLWEFDES